ncbi:MAG: hypothetical protein ACRDRS_06235 [Pseudonocardiaceae bacterium]
MENRYENESGGPAVPDGHALVPLVINLHDDLTKIDTALGPVALVGSKEAYRLAEKVDLFDNFQIFHAGVVARSAIARSSPDYYLSMRGIFVALRSNISQLSTDFLAQARKDLGNLK